MSFQDNKMLIMPAVDIKNGKCVQLVQGEPGTEQVIIENPEKVAGKWEDLGAEVVHVIDLDGAYGLSHMHIMIDPDENVFVWTTASKKWETGKTYHLRGTVKEHRTYRNIQQTCLTRCIEIKQK